MPIRHSVSSIKDETKAGHNAYNAYTNSNQNKLHIAPNAHTMAPGDKSIDSECELQLQNVRTRKSIDFDSNTRIFFTNMPHN